MKSERFLWILLTVEIVALVAFGIFLVVGMSV